LIGTAPDAILEDPNFLGLRNWKGERRKKEKEKKKKRKKEKRK